MLRFSEQCAGAIEQLMRIHYGHFMSNSRFWYERDLQEADALLCVAASNLRRIKAMIPGMDRTR